jgi:hypothetical protein
LQRSHAKRFGEAGCRSLKVKRLRVQKFPVVQPMGEFKNSARRKSVLRWINATDAQPKDGFILSRSIHLAVYATAFRYSGVRHRALAIGDRAERLVGRGRCKQLIKVTRIFAFSR